MDKELFLDDVETGRTPHLASPSATPSRFVSAKEEWELLFDGKPSQVRYVAELKGQGETHENIANKLGISVKTVQRVLKRLAEKKE